MTTRAALHIFASMTAEVLDACQTTRDDNDDAKHNTITTKTTNNSFKHSFVNNNSDYDNHDSDSEDNGSDGELQWCRERRVWTQITRTLRQCDTQLSELKSSVSQSRVTHLLMNELDARVLNTSNTSTSHQSHHSNSTSNTAVITDADNNDIEKVKAIVSQINPQLYKRRFSHQNKPQVTSLSMSDPMPNDVTHQNNDTNTTTTAVLRRTSSCCDVQNAETTATLSPIEDTSASLSATRDTQPQQLSPQSTTNANTVPRRPRLRRHFLSLDDSEDANGRVSEEVMDSDRRRQLNLSLDGTSTTTTSCAPLKQCDTSGTSVVRQREHHSLTTTDKSKHRYSAFEPIFTNYNTNSTQTTTTPTTVSTFVTSGGVSGSASVTRTDSSTSQSLTPPKSQMRRYSKKRLRGPYGEMLEESMKRSHESRLTTTDNNAAIVSDLSFLQELLSETRDQRRELDSNAKETTGQARDDSVGPTLARDLNLDTRTHVVGEVYDTEKSFVESLRVIRDRYYRPLMFASSANRLSDTTMSENALQQCLSGHSLQSIPVLDSEMVATIFFKTEDILQIHTQLLEALRRRLAEWSPEQTVADVVHTHLSPPTVAHTYAQFVANWSRAKHALRVTRDNDTNFRRFLELEAREHRLKLGLDELLITPVQRVPRYELLLKELLRHTTRDHPDHALIVDALRVVHELVTRIDADDHEHNSNALTLRDLEPLIGGTAVPSRALLFTDHSVTYEDNTAHNTHSAVKARSSSASQSHASQSTANTLNTCSLFLLSDCLLITSRDSSSKKTRVSSSSVVRHKVVAQHALADIELVSSVSGTRVDSVSTALSSANNTLTTDLNVVKRIAALVESLSRDCVTQWPQLSACVSDMTRDLSSRLELTSNQMNTCRLVCTRESGVGGVESVMTSHVVVIRFSNSEKCHAFESALLCAKQRILAMMLENTRVTALSATPSLVATIPCRKTRAGLQFTCATPADPFDNASRDVWICISDGFTAQISVLVTSARETQVVSCNGVANSRITSIVAVPKQHVTSTATTTDVTQQVVNTSMCEASVTSLESTQQVTTTTTTTTDDNTSSPQQQQTSSHVQSMDATGATVWFGTDSGDLHVYCAREQIRIRKNKVKVTLSSKVEAITFCNERVFCALEDGRVCVFTRDTDAADGRWCTEPRVFDDVHVYRFCVVQHVVLLCAFGASLAIRDTQTLQLVNEMVLTLNDENTEHVMNSNEVNMNDDLINTNDVIITSTTNTSINDNSVDNNNKTSIALKHAITSCVSLSTRVFVAFDNSCVIRVIDCNQQTNEMIVVMNIDVSISVCRSLECCDSIIRKHKQACLRITCLLAIDEQNKTQIWFGTSAGIVGLFRHDSNDYDNTCTDVEVLPNGHTGHVRFLTCIAAHNSDHVLVISGGDGVEEFVSKRAPQPMHDRNTATTTTTAHTPTMTSQLNDSSGQQTTRATELCLESSSTRAQSQCSGSGSGLESGKDDSTNYIQIFKVR